MSIPSFSEQREAWSNPPVDDVGYLSADELLTRSDSELIDLVQKMWHARYYGWRNHENKWRDVLGLDGTTGKKVLDYGCGVGIESLDYARLGNRVHIADIAPSNVMLAERVLKVFGEEAAGTYVIKGRRPFISVMVDGSLDVIHCSGVLHHIPSPVPVVAQMANWLKKDGELRLMLYSDVAWRLAAKTEPPQVVAEDPNFMLFVRTWDGVGGYADWYDRDRLQNRFGEWFSVKRCEPLTMNGEYIGAVLKRL